MSVCKIMTINEWLLMNALCDYNISLVLLKQITDAFIK